MKKTILLLAVLAMLAGASAKPVSPFLASEVASHFFPNTQLRTVEMDGMYLFAPDGGNGFVLVANDDCVRPVLAYSPDGTFDPNAMPVHLRRWIEGYAREIASVKEAGLSQSAAVAAEWNYYLGEAPKTFGDTIAPMLTSVWNQGNYFNTLCPYDTQDSMRCYTGCTATATAQIMNYWEHPAVGWGSNAYYHPRYGILTAMFDTTYYRWDMMPDTLNYLTDPDSALAVAELMYHVGVAVNMNYGTSGSGAAVNAYGSTTRPSAENALKTYFKYSPMLYGVLKTEYTDSEWDSLMHSEVAAGRPVLYAGYDSSGGHAFVLDGCQLIEDSLSTRLFFHVNWGWGGAYDGYYTLDSLSPGAGGAGGNATYTFNISNSAIVGIIPITAAADSMVTVSLEPNFPGHGTVSGSGYYRTGVDTVNIWARAAEGYRFVRWQSGSLQNPLTFVAMGDMIDTAIFERLQGDTLGYCYDGLSTSWVDDYGSTTEWGIRIPASMRGAGRVMRAVQFFPYEGGDHTLKIYFGSNLASATLVHTQTISVTGAEYRQWNEFPLTDTFRVSGNDVVWVTMSYTGGGYPASMSRYCGNSDGSWYHLPQGWAKFDEEDIFYGSWMLRGVFEPRTITIDVQPADPNICTTFGEGTYRGGDPVTIGAVILDPRCTFQHWSDGSPFNPYTFTASDDTLMVAHCHCDGLGIDDADADIVEVTVEGRTVSVNTDAEFYDLQGRLLARGSRASMPVAGVYVLRIGSAAKKVVVL